MNRVRQPFNVNHLAMVAACAALGDDAFIAREPARERRGAGAARARLRAAGPRVHPVRRATSSRCAWAMPRASTPRCCAEGVIVRPVAGYGMPEHLRVTVGHGAAERALPRRPRARARGRIAVGRHHREAVVRRLKTDRGHRRRPHRRLLRARDAPRGRRRAGSSASTATRRPSSAPRRSASSTRRPSRRRRRRPAPTSSSSRCRCAPSGPCCTTSRSGLGPDAVVTDAGSTKADVVRTAARELRDRAAAVRARAPDRRPRGERRGGRDARPLPGRARGAHARGRDRARRPSALVRACWEACGARVTEMPAAAHDRIFASVSHLPHLLAFALVSEIVSRPDAAELLGFAAGGFRDFTRIAASSPEMWRDIALANRDALLEEMDRYAARVAVFRELVARGDGPGPAAAHDRGAQRPPRLDGRQAQQLRRMSRGDGPPRPRAATARRGHGAPARLEEHLQPHAAPRGARRRHDAGARAARLRRHARDARGAARAGRGAVAGRAPGATGR